MVAPSAPPVRQPCMNHLRVATVIFVPIVCSFFLFLPRFYTPEGVHRAKFEFQLNWVYVFLVAAIFWITNVLPLAVTAFIPLVGFPLLGIVTSKLLADIFMTNVNMLNLSLLIIALAIDCSGLRKRMTLRILKHSRGSLRWIYTYVYLATTMIAMWFGGTLAAFLMMRAVDDITENLREGVKLGSLGEDRMTLMNELTRKCEGLPAEDKTKNATETTQSNEVKDDKSLTIKTNPDHDKGKDVEQSTRSLVPGKVTFMDSFEEKKCFEEENQQLLNIFGGELVYAIAVAANIGGILWPYGSPMGCELFKLKYAVPFAPPGTAAMSYGWTEASWLSFSLPLIIINSLIAYAYLRWVHFSDGTLTKWLSKLGNKPLENFNINSDTMGALGEFYSAKHAELPVFSFQEKGTLILLPLMVVLNLTRLPVFMSGWTEIIRFKPVASDAIEPRIDVGDSAIAALVILLLFFAPKVGFEIFRPAESPTQKPKFESFVSWKFTQTYFPWDIVMLIGGSNCIGKYSESTVAGPIANWISGTISKPGAIAVQIILIGLTVFSTHCMSTPGTSIAVMQIWSKLVVNYNKSGNLIGGALILPVITAASLCFVIPASSIPTALVYRYHQRKHLSMWYFLKVGIPLLACTLIATIVYAIVWTPDALTVY